MPSSGGFKFARPRALQSAVAVQGATIRGRPADDAPVVQELGAGSAVELSTHLENASGIWWYVTSQTISGWIRQTDLQMH
jgi:hypothetical protein